MLKFLRFLRDWLTDLFQVLSACRYSVLVLLIGAICFLTVPQGQDVLRRMVEWRGTVDLRLLILFMVAVVLWAASTWYWARVILSLREPYEPPSTPRQDRLREWVPRILGFLALASMAAALATAANNYAEFSEAEPIFRLRLMAGICGVLAIVFLVIVSQRRRWMKAPDSPCSQFSEFADLPAATRMTALLFLLLGLVLGLVFTFWPLQVAPALGTQPIVLLMAAVWVLFGTALLYLSRRLRFPLVLFLLVCAAVFSRWNDNHAIRTDGVDRRTAQDTIAARLQAWPGSTTGRPIFIVAAEGGGIRAAYWTALVLGDLEDRYPGFSQQVFAISGVSGGSLGGSIFTALVADSQSGRKPDCGSYRDCTDSILQQDFLSPTLAKMIAPDLAQRVLFFRIPFADRARALEDSWARGWTKAVGTQRFDQPFLSLWESKPTAVPALVLNGTHVETGRRILTTNLKWRREHFRDAYDLIRVLRSDVPLKTAVHNSARFTYVSPAGTMRPRNAADPGARGHVVDGGYFENSGTGTALELVEAVMKSCGATCGNRLYVLYLRNNPETDLDMTLDPAMPEQDEKDLEPYTRSYPRLNELLSPPRALVNTSNARSTLAVEALRNEIGVPRFLEFGLCEKGDTKNGRRRAPLPLGWQLSESAREAMKTQLDNGCWASDNKGMRELVGELLGYPGAKGTVPAPATVLGQAIPSASPR